MNYESLRVERAGDVLTLWLNQPEKRNALSPKMIEELTDFFDQMSHDPARVIVLRGEGAVFCAGGDLAWMRAQLDADRKTRMREARKLANMLGALNATPKPLISVVHGGAFGGALGVMSVSDVVISTHDAKFGFTETRLGLIPATIGPYVLARMGEGMARRVFMSARIFDAEEAAALGLVGVVNDDVDSEIARQVKPYLSTAPHAVAHAKALARRLGANIQLADIEDSIEALADCWESAETRAGIEAFFAKTSPPWIKE